MPLTVNVCLGRKSSRDFQSSNTSISISAELDQSLLAKPERLRREIDDLFEKARGSLERQRNDPPPPALLIESRTRANGASHNRNRNASRNGGQNGNAANGNVGRTGAMTISQRRAINAISSRNGLDPNAEARDLIGADLNQLTVRQASDLIDHLKGQLASADRQA